MVRLHYPNKIWTYTLQIDTNSASIWNVWTIQPSTIWDTCTHSSTQCIALRQWNLLKTPRKRMKDAFELYQNTRMHLPSLMMAWQAPEDSRLQAEGYSTGSAYTKLIDILRGQSNHKMGVVSWKLKTDEQWLAQVSGFEWPVRIQWLHRFKTQDSSWLLLVTRSNLRPRVKKIMMDGYQIWGFSDSPVPHCPVLRRHDM